MEEINGTWPGSFLVGSCDRWNATGWTALAIPTTPVSDNTLSSISIMLTFSCKSVSGVENCKKAHLSSTTLIKDYNWH